MIVSLPFPVGAGLSIITAIGIGTLAYWVARRLFGHQVSADAKNDVKVHTSVRYEF